MFSKFKDIFMEKKQIIKRNKMNKTNKTKI